MRLGPILLLGLVLGGCAEPDATVIRFGLADSPTNLDPRYATDATSSRLVRLLYRQLVDFDADFRPVPALARWEQLAPRHYRFHLGEAGRGFHDGTRLTSADVQATYRFILTPSHGSPHRGPLAMIERVEVPDPDTVDFFLTRPDPLFPGYLQQGIVPAAAIAAGHRFQDEPLGSGSFELVQRAGDDRLRLRRVGDGQVIELVTVRDPTVRVLKLLRGELDITQNELPPELIDYLEARGEVRVVRMPGINFSYLGFNLEDPTTGDLRVRRAVAHAIDRAAIIEHLWAGAARPAEALLVPEHWAGHRALDPIRYDPPRARDLLAQLGYGHHAPLRLTLKTSTNPLRVRIATVIQQQLAEVGIDLELRTFDWGTFFGDIKTGRFQLYGLTWVGTKSPDIFRSAFHSASLPPAGANRGRYRSPGADALIEAAEVATTPASQARLYQRLQGLLQAELPYVPLWYEDQVVVFRTEITGYQPTPDGSYDALVDLRRQGGGGSRADRRAGALADPARKTRGTARSWAELGYHSSP